MNVLTGRPVSPAWLHGTVTKNYTSTNTNLINLLELLFPTAEPVAYNEPKVVVDKSVQESTETWEDVSGPSFDPEKRQSEACYMM